MTKKYLLDTSVWRDFYEDRISKIGRPLGKFANDLYLKILKDKDKIIYSETLIWELKKDYSEDNILDMLNILLMSKILVKIDIEKDEFTEAKKLATLRNIPLVDCINAIHARNHKAIMISQDSHFLKDLKDIVETKRPEDII